VENGNLQLTGRGAGAPWLINNRVIPPQGPKPRFASDAPSRARSMLSIQYRTRDGGTQSSWQIPHRSDRGVECRVGARSPNRRQNSAPRSRNSAPAAARLGSLCIICLPAVFVRYLSSQTSSMRQPL
jgi:hypothetical protein